MLVYDNIYVKGISLHNFHYINVLENKAIHNRIKIYFNDSRHRKCYKLKYIFKHK